MRIIIDRVNFAYGRRCVLNNVTWSIGPGVTGLLGPNGAGKTTLINLLVGLSKPDAGRILIADGATREPAREAGCTVGFLPQRFTLAGEMRVVDTITYAAWSNGVAPKKCRDAAIKALDLVQLGEQSNYRVRSLSGGQRQRVGLAAALSHDPEVIVLDEPTAGLDPGQRLSLRNVIAGIGRRRTVLLSTHLIEDISHLCGRVGILVDGDVVFDGTPQEIANLIKDSESSDLPGSDFERAYYTVVSQLRDSS